MRLLLPLAAAVALSAGCGADAVTRDGAPAAPYAGPMHLPLDRGDDASVLDRSGAAGRALECDGEPYDGGGASYDSGLETVQDDAAAALDDLFDQGAWEDRVPLEGYAVEREEGRRVLLSFDAAGRTKVAFIAADGIRDFEGDAGWGIEAWAQCDPSELPASVTDGWDLGIWTDASGRRAPVTTIRSFRGAEHCGWQDLTFLLLGPDEETADWYVGGRGGELDELLRTTFDATARAPEGATDTGFVRDGRRLWLGPREQAAYLVAVGDPSDVERWPAAKGPIMCA